MTRTHKAEDVSLQITGGKWRGRVISSPNGLQLRPTGSKVRQAFFNILSNKLNACSFLDLCAGTGIMGIEALSRGAQSLIAVESDRKTAKAIVAKLEHLGYAGEVICSDLSKVLPALNGQTFDIIFADPPYKCDLHESIICLVEKYKLLSEEGTLVIEHMKSLVLKESYLSIYRSSIRNYGQSSLSFYVTNLFD